MKKHTSHNSGTDTEWKHDEEMNSENSFTQEESLPGAEQTESTPEAKLEIELTEARDKYLRLYSEFENYKKRVSRDRVEWTKTAGSDILLSFLPVIDDMERALKAMKDADDAKAVKTGLELIYNKLKAVAESKGLKPMESIGKTFDPELHDAITNVPASSEKMKGKVMDEVEKGYYLNDKVIRHAKVIVGS